MPNTTTSLPIKSTISVNQSPSPEQLRQTTGLGWMIEIRNPQAEEFTSNTTGGVTTPNRSSSSLEVPRATIRTAMEQRGHAIADYVQRFHEAMSSSE